jgi:hypothetical protein
MEILLFNEKGLSKIWYVPPVLGPFADEIGTEARKAVWDEKLTVCRREGYRFGGHFVLIISVRSRMRPADISDKEMNEFNDMVDNLKSRKKAS